MKKILAILLLFSLTVPFSGTYLYLQFKERQVRQEIAVKMLMGLKQKEMVVLKFTETETQTRLNWKHSREFEYNGQMYDIVQQTSHGDSVFYTCYKDHKETRLNKQKERIIAKAVGQDQTRKNQNEKLTNFFKTVFSHDAFAWNPTPIQASDIHFSFFTIHYSLFSPVPLSPPPKYS